MKMTRQEMESELQSLRPRPLSDPARDDIARQLASTQRKERPSSPWIWRSVALAVAASIAFAAFLLPRSEDESGRSASLQPVRIDRSAVAVVEHVPPTMLAYGRVFDQSLDDLDQLLDRHAATLLVAGSPSDDIGSLYADVFVN
jgi:hypothetical protein